MRTRADVKYTVGDLLEWVARNRSSVRDRFCDYNPRYYDPPHYVGGYQEIDGVYYPWVLIANTRIRKTWYNRVKLEIAGVLAIVIPEPIFNSPKACNECLGGNAEIVAMLTIKNDVSSCDRTGDVLDDLLSDPSYMRTYTKYQVSRMFPNGIRPMRQRNERCFEPLCNPNIPLSVKGLAEEIPLTTERIIKYDPRPCRFLLDELGEHGIDCLNCATEEGSLKSDHWKAKYWVLPRGTLWIEGLITEVHGSGSKGYPWEKMGVNILARSATNSYDASYIVAVDDTDMHPNIEVIFGYPVYAVCIDNRMMIKKLLQVKEWEAATIYIMGQLAQPNLADAFGYFWEETDLRWCKTCETLHPQHEMTHCRECGSNICRERVYNLLDGGGPLCYPCYDYITRERSW